MIIMSFDIRELCFAIVGFFWVSLFTLFLFIYSVLVEFDIPENGTGLLCYCKKSSSKGLTHVLNPTSIAIES